MGIYRHVNSVIVSTSILYAESHPSTGYSTNPKVCMCSSQKKTTATTKLRKSKEVLPDPVKSLSVVGSILLWLRRINLYKSCNTAAEKKL